ncbi:hypothetical protein N0V90_011382 [Kalmusia sp. IMI 367209]|nr:hypothetical protein N0V90_011382 [Kalmusia sp. IMI 367209]
MSTIIASILAVEHPEVVKALVLAHPIYCGTPPALVTMTEAMIKDRSVAPDLVAKFFEDFMYTPQTPEWLRTWQIRRVQGTDAIALAGCGQGVVDLFGSVIGQTAETKAFMKKRAAPKLVVATNALPAAAAWEEELGLGMLDQIFYLNEGTFSHFVENEKFNQILQDWLKNVELGAANFGRKS